MSAKRWKRREKAKTVVAVPVLYVWFSREEMRMRSVLHYPGGKKRIASWIIKHMPPHHSYLEPYFGCGAVLFAKQPAPIETVNDLDGEVGNGSPIRLMPDRHMTKLSGWIRKIQWGALPVLR